VVLSEEYAKHLREVRGFAPSTVGHHRYASQCFLNHLQTKKVPLASIQPKDVEAYIKQAGKRLCRGSLQHDIAALRAVFYAFSQQMAGLPPDWIAGSTLHDFTGLSNCLLPSRGRQ